MDSKFENQTVIEKTPGKFVFLTRLLIAVFILIVLLVLSVMIFMPRIAKSYINKNGKELTGRKVYVEKIKLNYFTSTLQVIGFRFFEQDDSTLFAKFDTMMVNMKPLKLLKDEIYVEQFQLINPQMKVIQNDTVFNFSDLLDFYTSDSTVAGEPVDTVAGMPYKLNLNLLEIKNGYLGYTDQSINHTINLKDLNFVVPQILWSRLDSSKADISFKLGDKGTFASSMNYNMTTGDFTGFAEIKNLDAVTILPYIQQYLKVSAIQGNFFAGMYFEGNESKTEDVIIHGFMQVDSLEIRDNQNRKVIGGQSSMATLYPSKPMKYEMIIDTVQFDKPYIYLALEDSLFNFEKMMIETEEESSSSQLSAESETEIPMNVVLNRFIINDGLMDFSDQTLREVFNYELSKIKVDMDSFSLHDEWVNIIATMKLNKRGTLDARLGLNPLDPMQRIELDYVLTDFQLPDINIYSKHYAGLPILFGDMYYVNKTKIINHQLESNNQLIIRNVEMGRKTGGLYDVPIKLALFVLKDINGDIVLDIPVRGNLADPKVKIGPIIWDTFKSFVFKIVASPFKALAGLLGADPKELEEITFDYGDTTLVAKQIRSFNLLLDLGKKKPEMLIEMHYLNDKKLERTDAASQIASEIFFQKTGTKAGSNNREYQKFLKETTGKDSLVIQDYELLVAPAAMIDSAIQLREKLRIDLTRQYFAQKNDSSKIRIFDYNREEVLNIGSRPRFEVRYTLAEDAEEK
jgi:hypothetical protein